MMYSGFYTGIFSGEGGGGKVYSIQISIVMLFFLLVWETFLGGRQTAFPKSPCIVCGQYIGGYHEYIEGIS